VITLLINSVLDALANYTMDTAFLPPALLHILEGLPATFRGTLWIIPLQPSAW
jgi:hypothetical protein